MSDSDEPREDELSRDETTIREWADEHGVVPVRETETAGEGAEGRFTLVPEDALTESQERVEWNAFVEALEEGDQVVVHRGPDAAEPLGVSHRDEYAEHLDDEAVEARLLEGETVTSTITETAVVESVVVEESTVESELVDSQVRNERVTDVELKDREVLDCQLVPHEELDAAESFDVERYLSTTPAASSGSLGATSSDSLGGEGTPEEELRDDEMLAEGTEPGAGDRSATGTEAGAGTDPESDRPGDETAPPAGRDRTDYAGDEPPREGAGAPETGPGEPVTDSDAEPPRGQEAGLGSEEFASGEFPYHVEMEVEETWAVTREFDERYTVESRVTDTEVAEADTMAEHDVDVEGLHRSIAASGLVEFGADLGPEDVLEHYEVDSDIGEGDRIRTTFVRERVLAEDVREHKRLWADVRDVDVVDVETIGSEAVLTTGAGETGGATAAADTEAGSTGEIGSTEGPANATGSQGTAVAISEDDVGKSVVDATGDEVGLVTDVEPDSNVLYVEAEPGLTERIQAALGWGGGDEDDYRLRVDKIQAVTDDAVELKPSEHLTQADEDRPHSDDEPTR